MSAPICPRCGHHIPNDEEPGAYPGAISRWDNLTEVCSKCGQDEALIVFNVGLSGLRASYERVSAILHPTTGLVTWVLVPESAK